VRGFLAALAALLPMQASACEGVTRHFMLCADGSAWAAAEWDQFGDGVTVHLAPYAFDSVEDWAGRHTGEAPTTAAALDLLIADRMKGQVDVDHLRDAFATPHLTVERVVQTITFEGDPPIRRASMMAEGGGHRVLLMLTAPGDTPPEVLAQASRDLVNLLRPSAGDQP